MLNVIKIAWFFSLASLPLKAGEVTWWTFEIPFAYRDLSYICSTASGPYQLYLAGEIEGGTELARAVLYSYPHPPFQQGIELSKSEVSTARVKTDSNHRRWLEKIVLEPKTIVWLLFHAGGGDRECKPSQAIKSLAISELAIAFDLSGISPQLEKVESNFLPVSGRLQDSSLFQSEMTLFQKQYGGH